MIVSTAPPRPNQVAAVALLLLIHAAAIVAFIHAGVTRDHSDERMVQLLLLALTRPVPVPQAPLPESRPVRPRRPWMAPVPPVGVEMPASPSGATAVAAAPSDGRSPDTAASTAAPGKLDLAIPKDFYAHAPPLTPAQEAMRDPRSNHLELTKQEKMDIAFGTVECVAWQREPDGSIYRGPGHRQRVQGISTNTFTAHQPGTEDRSTECVK